MPYLEKMRLRALPGSYTRDSAMNLVPPRRADTTNTSLRESAKSGKIEGLRFDAAGFNADPLGGEKERRSGTPGRTDEDRFMI